MPKTETIVFYGICALFLFAEVVNFLRRKGSGKVLDKYLCSLPISIVILTVADWFRTAEIETFSPTTVILALFLGMTGTFLLLVYLLFRGISVLLSISSKGAQHPVCQALDNMAKYRLATYGFISILVLVCFLGSIFSIVWRFFD